MKHASSLVEESRMRAAIVVFLLAVPGQALVASQRPASTRRHRPRMNLLGFLEGLGGSKSFDGPCVMGEEELMRKKKHGTSDVPVQANLRWNCDGKTADNICNFNRHYAEYAGYWGARNDIPQGGGADH